MYVPTQVDYHTSWVFYMAVLFALSILQIVLLAESQATGFIDSIVLFYASFMVITSTIPIPLAMLITSCIRIVALQSVTEHHVRLLVSTRFICALFPMAVFVQLWSSVNSTKMQLIRRIAIETLAPVSLCLALYLLTGLSFHLWGARPWVDTIDVLLAMPYENPHHVVLLDPIEGRIWYAIFRTIPPTSALLVSCVAIRTVLVFDKSRAELSWRRRWHRAPSGTFMQLYTIPGQLILSFSRACIPVWRTCLATFEQVSRHLPSTFQECNFEYTH